MGILTLRLPENLDARLNALSALENSSRSELARMALEKFLSEMEREKLLAGMAMAGRFLAQNPAARSESANLAEDFSLADSEALTLAEKRQPSDADSEPWWR